MVSSNSTVMTKRLRVITLTGSASPTDCPETGNTCSHTLLGSSKLLHPKPLVRASQEERHRLLSSDLIIIASQAILDHLGTLLPSTMQTLYGTDSSVVVWRARAAVHQTSRGFARRSLLPSPVIIWK